MLSLCQLQMQMLFELISVEKCDSVAWNCYVIRCELSEATFLPLGCTSSISA